MKTIQDFTQTSSIVQRLRLIILLMAVLLLVASLATWISSRRYIEELQILNQLNRLMSLSTRATQNVISARESLDKFLLDTSEKGREHIPGFEASLDQAELAILAGRELSGENEKIRAYFLEAGESLNHLEESGRRLLDLWSINNAVKKDEAMKEQLLMKQFELEVVDDMRQARVEMGGRSDVLLDVVYRNRYTPFLVSLGISLLFFAAALTLGMSVTRRLRASIETLLLATDQVAAGNLQVPIRVQSHDEIGRLTFAFDRMLINLRESIERNSHLQKITAEFSRALDPKEVADAVVEEGISILGASAGAVLTAPEKGKGFEFLRSHGFSENSQEFWGALSLDHELPVTRALKEFHPYFAETRDEVFRNFPPGTDRRLYDVASSMVIPLGEGGDLIGVLTFRFPRERIFSEAERSFALTLGALATQAYKRASLYEDAQKAVEIRDSFLSIAAHELKTPLTSLKLQVQLGEMQVAKSGEIPLSPDRIARIFRVCHSQADRLNSLVDDLLDVGRIERGTIVYNFTDCDLRILVDSVIDRFGEALRLRDCTVEQVAPDPLIVRGDQFRLEQVLINLLSNAVKYGQEKPVLIRIGRKGPEVFVSVIDHGMGIAPEKQSLIFDRFERAISSRNISGLGLGLYISRRIIDAHKGEISVVSELGKGSTFTVCLPPA